MSKKTFIIIFSVFLLLALFLYFSYQKNQKQIALFKANPTLATETETQKLVNALEKLMQLPKDETPQIATVTDKTKLGTDIFFKDAQNGDRLLIYSKNKQVILFRPNTGKIINVGNISLSKSQ